MSSHLSRGSRELRGRAPQRAPRSGLQSSTDDSKGSSKDKAWESNVQVVVRCRGRIDREVKENANVAVQTLGPKSTEVIVQPNPSSALMNKSYSFDTVFGPDAGQQLLFDEIAAPIIREFVSGFNCTIFAYGQTGTGKTHTMTGEIDDNPERVTSKAGIIPRALYRIFSLLESEFEEYSVKISFMELYNEEVRDLLAYEEEKKLKIYDDQTHKGSVVIQDIEEAIISSPAEGLKYLIAGCLKRQTAATKINDFSSRSHTVFTITAMIKEQTEGEDMIKIGKLNLVDLAGSENIGRSGAENKRAREAGIINQSLLTLGRVINSLVERSSHVPYRESKLTRILQDSLGGRTRTCIVATIGPARAALDETISTLDYASRAKNIKNRPQCNQLFTKKTLIREFVVEIERLKADLNSTRAKNGVFMTQESYKEMTESNENLSTLSEEQTRKISTLEESLKTTQASLDGHITKLKTTEDNLEQVKYELNATRNKLERTEKELHSTNMKLGSEILLRKAFENNEKQLDQNLKSLSENYRLVVDHNQKLHDKLEQVLNREKVNTKCFSDFRSSLLEMSRGFDQFSQQFHKDYSSESEHLAKMISISLKTVTDQSSETTCLIENIFKRIDSVLADTEKEFVKGNASSESSFEKVEAEFQSIKEELSKHWKLSNQAESRTKNEILGALESIQINLHNRYSELGLSVKQFFDDARSHLESQVSDIHRLASDSLKAGDTALKGIKSASHGLEEFAASSSATAKQRRAELISRIEALIVQTLEENNKDIHDGVSKIIKTNDSTQNSFLASMKTFKEGIESWAGKESSNLRHLQVVRDDLKGQIVTAGREVSESNTGLQKKVEEVISESEMLRNSSNAAFEKHFHIFADASAALKGENKYFGNKIKDEIVSVETLAKQGYVNLNSSMSQSFGQQKSALENLNGLHQKSVQVVGDYVENSKETLSVTRKRTENTYLQETQSNGSTPKRRKYDPVPEWRLVRSKMDSVAKNENISNSEHEERSTSDRALTELQNRPLNAPLESMSGKHMISEIPLWGKSRKSQTMSPSKKLEGK